MQLTLAPELARSLLKIMHEVRLGHDHATVSPHHLVHLLLDHGFVIVAVRVEVIRGRLILPLIHVTLHLLLVDDKGGVAALVKRGASGLMDHDAFEVAACDFGRALGVISHRVVRLAHATCSLVLGLGEIGQEVGLLVPEQL